MYQRPGRSGSVRGRGATFTAGLGRHVAVTSQSHRRAVTDGHGEPSAVGARHGDRASHESRTLSRLCRTALTESGPLKGQCDSDAAAVTVTVTARAAGPGGRRPGPGGRPGAKVTVTVIQRPAPRPGHSDRAVTITVTATVHTAA